MTNGRCALITGSARGLGKGITRRLAAEGWTVAVNDIAEDATHALVEQPNNEGFSAIAAVTIIDIALPYNLMKRGHIELAEFIGTPFIYDPSNGIHDVQYLPMVVDNDGPNRVDDLR